MAPAIEYRFTGDAAGDAVERLRMKAWLQTHKGLAIALGLAAAVILYRLFKGSASAGHTSPQDAISYGWSVSQAGITGWLEVSPDGQTQYLHNTGWVGDPYQTS